MLLFLLSISYGVLLTRMNWVYHNENVSFYAIYSWLKMSPFMSFIVDSKSYVNFIHFLPVNACIQCFFLFLHCLFWWSIALCSGKRTACKIWKFYPFLSILLEIWHTTDLQSSAQLVSNINNTSGVLSCCRCILFINASFSSQYHLTDCFCPKIMVPYSSSSITILRSYLVSQISYFYFHPP